MSIILLIKYILKASTRVRDKNKNNKQIIHIWIY